MLVATLPLAAFPQDGSSEAPPSDHQGALDDLRALANGSLREGPSVRSLVGTAVDELDAVRRRRAEIGVELQRLRVAVDTSEPDLEANELEANELEANERSRAIEAAELRASYLERLESFLESIPEAGRAALHSLGQNRDGLRGRAAELDAAASDFEAAAARLRTLGTRAGAGSLVGFRSQRDDTEAALVRAAGELTDGADELRARGAQVHELADAIEADGRALRRQVLLAAALEDPSERLDPLFQEHVREQRRQRRIEERLRAGPDAPLADIRAAAAALVADPGRPDSLAEAEDAAAGASALVSRIAPLSAARDLTAGYWRLAYANNAVLVLSSGASRDAVSSTYTLSTRIGDDVRAELVEALARGRLWLDDRRRAVLRAGRLVADGELAVESRWLAALALLGAWWLLWRNAGRLINQGVRRLSRLEWMHGRLGVAVRWAGLLHKTLALVALYPVVRGALALTFAHTPEGDLFLALFEPIYFFVLGGRLIEGLTQRIARGRPALVDLEPKTAARLLRSYRQLGVMLAGTWLVSRVARVTIGAGYVALLAQTVALLWVVAQAAKECVTWRHILGREWRSLLPVAGDAEAEAKSDDASEPAAPNGLEARLCDAMTANKWGAVLSPVAFVRVVATRTWRAATEFARRSDLGRRLAAARLRRNAGQNEEPEAPLTDLPPRYLDAFPLFPLLGDEEGLIVPRDESLGTIREHVDRWREDRRQSSLVVLGEKGMGKTTLLAMTARGIKDAEVTRLSLADKILSPEALVRELSRHLGVETSQPPSSEDDGGIQAFAEALEAGPERVVLLDEAHNVFLRVVGGYRAYDALVRLVNATSDKVFWLLAFNSLTWTFLNEMHGRTHYFRRLLRLPVWDQAELTDLVRRRNQLAGVDLEFDDALVAYAGGDDDDFALLEGADDYFRLLWDASGGNPRVASRLWLSSLVPLDETRLRVRLFPQPPSDWAKGLTDELLFALAAFGQHENLNAQELASVLNLDVDFARFAVRYLTEQQMIEAKHGAPDRSTLAAGRYPHVLKLLRTKHLLFGD